MYKWQWLSVMALLIMAGLVLGAPGPALAASGTPLKSFKVQMGPYPVTVNYYTEPKGGQALVFNIVPDQPVGGPMTYQVTAIPGTMVNAVPVKAVLQEEPGNPGGIAGRVNLPISGQWLLRLDSEGPAGPGFGDVPVLASAPPAMPEWLGWAIGLIPVWAILGFVLAQARRAGRPAAAPRPGPAISAS
ncbi:MAG TPA: hypothetical protein VKY74_08785 [Chloroflexia bacterium]|nr:hypothetical protein [Chloroflexia bacterium]